jgi:hypothetical protein
VSFRQAISALWQKEKSAATADLKISDLQILLLLDQAHQKALFKTL